MTSTTRYPAPDLSSLPEDIRTRILAVQEKAGFIPNVFLGLARRPAEWRAFFAYHDALMLVEEGSNPTGSLTKGEREMIVTTTSAANQCLYCVVAHGAILRIYEKKPLVAGRVASQLKWWSCAKSSACSARRRPHVHAKAWTRTATRRCAARTSANRHLGCDATPSGRELPQGRHQRTPARHAGLCDDGLQSVPYPGRRRL